MITEGSILLGRDLPALLLFEVMSPRSAGLVVEDRTEADVPDTVSGEFDVLLKSRLVEAG